MHVARKWLHAFSSCERRETKLKDLDQEECEEHINSLLAKHRRTTVYQMHDFLRPMLNDAVACGYLYQNTLQKIDIGESPLEPFDKELSMDQFKAIDAVARELLDDSTYAMVRLTYFGLRQSEVIAVKIKTIINRPDGLVALAHSNSKSKFRPDGKDRRGKERMKSKSSERVTVLDQETSELILKAVNRAKEIAKDYNRILGPEDFIFLVDYPGARYKGESVLVGRLAYLFEAISTKSGIHITPHMMRHFFVTQGLLSGISLEQMASAVGHTKSYMTEKYSHTQEEMAAQASQAFALAIK